MSLFNLVSEFRPTGDQPEAIAKLGRGLADGAREQVLLGVTGSGKTYTIANVVAAINRPTLVLAHNKTLAAQLCGEFRQFFPHNAVEYFVSYYDYYQPEAYIPRTDTYIEKDAQINEEIDKLRHSATSALLERRDVIIVASVSCIYGLGSPTEYAENAVSLRVGMHRERNELLRRLVAMQYVRNDIAFERGTFRVRGDSVEIIPAAQMERALRVEFFGSEIERITEIDTLTGEILGRRNHVAIFPASHFVTSNDKLQLAIVRIESELQSRLSELREQDKILEAQRLEQRCRYDLEMMREVGFCSGIENYSRHLEGRAAGTPPHTLLDYFPKDFLLVVDESHVTLPQVRGMYAGDRSRKTVLVEHGFRLPSAMDNRPLTFAEFNDRFPQVIYVSATPAAYELARSAQVVEQIIRPTGLIDPEISVRPTRGQVDDLYGEIRRRIEAGERVLITTLTKRMAEDLTDYYKEMGVKVRYLHSDIETLERMSILRSLRLGEFDVLVGINLLREGLDLPEVSLVAILDADKEGFLRSGSSLIQTIGRAARNVHGSVIMYADRMTDSMRLAIGETDRRRERQRQYNREHHIVPTTVSKKVHEVIEATLAIDSHGEAGAAGSRFTTMTASEKAMVLKQVEADMKAAAKALQFERAATLRDLLIELKAKL